MNKDQKYIIPEFLLKCELIEFSLKHLLINYPFKDKDFMEDKKIEKLTLGGIITQLKNIKDSYIDDILNGAKELKDLRNNLTHNFIKLDASMDIIKSDILKHEKLFKKINEDILRYFHYVNEVYFNESNYFHVGNLS